MDPIIIFAILTAVVLAAVIVIDRKGQPFQMDKEYLSLKVLGVIPAVMFVFIILLNGTKVSGAIGVVYHLIILAIIARLKAPSWAKAAGYGWIALDVACGIMTLCNVPDDIAFPVRLGGHVLCGIWITVVCMFCRDRLLKYLGFFIASWLAVFSFFGGVLDMGLLAVPGVLVVVWLALMGWRYRV